MQFHGTGQAGQGEKNIVEKAAGQGSGTFAVCAAGLPQCRIYRGFFLGLDRRPQSLDLLGGTITRRGKHMRMTIFCAIVSTTSPKSKCPRSSAMRA